MRRLSIGLLGIAVVTTLVVLPAVAQTAPPKVILITQEHVKPGKMVAHEKMETAWAQGLKKTLKATPLVFGLNPIAGPSEVWFLWTADSVAEMAKLEDSFASGPAATLMQTYYPQETDFLTDSHSVMAVLEESVSTNPKVNWGEARYMIIGTNRIRKEHDAEYAEYEKMQKAAREKSGIKWSALIYDVISGDKPNAYIYIIPLKDLSIYSSEDVTLTPEDQKRRRELVDKTIIEQNEILFAISPGMSWPTAEMIATAPDFWTVKAVMAVKKSSATRTEAKEVKPKPTQ